MGRSYLAKLMQGFSEQRSKLLHKCAPFLSEGARSSRPAQMCALAGHLLSSRGEASGVAIATDLLDLYAASDPEERTAFLAFLARDLNPNRDVLERAWQRFGSEGWPALPQLAEAVEAPRQELFRRINLAPGGTAALVRMREDLLAREGLAIVDADLSHLLQSWFNRGFLSLKAITWSSPASLLERVIQYEAVHSIHDWDELRNRLAPPDRRCFAFFHPAMPDEPLIFVEVALARGIPDSIQSLLASDREILTAGRADTAVFYSISNCQAGLRGISFGHFLIKQVATDLKRACPALSTFVTLSPMPGLMNWLGKNEPQLAAEVVAQSPESFCTLRGMLLERAAYYLVDAKDRQGRPPDPVARFHLGNGARLERLNWMADSSEKGLRESAGMMVNYVYDLHAVEERHELFTSQGVIATGKPFRRMLQEIQSRKPSSAARVPISIFG